MIGTRARTAGLVESPLLSNGHGGFGKRFGETGRLKDRYRAPNRLRGGKDNFAADREAAQQVLVVAPDVPLAARENRGFLIRALHFLSEQAHVGQFIDIGPGLPTGTNVHHIAHRFHPDARVVYVDNDPVVVSHGRALLARQHPPVAMIEGDLREPARILADPQLRKLIDLREPTALCLTLVLHFLPDADRPHELVAELLGRLAPGSYLVLSHVTGDGKDPQVRDQITGIYDRASAPLVMRSRDQVARFFAGCAMVPPGLMYLAQWHRHADAVLLSSGSTRWAYGGVGVKQSRCTPASRHPGQAISALPVPAPAAGVPPTPAAGTSSPAPGPPPPAGSRRHNHDAKFPDIGLVRPARCLAGSRRA